MLTCSALKKVYRSKLIGAHLYPKVVFVYLKGTKEIILNRMLARNHFMPPSLLDSQVGFEAEGKAKGEKVKR